MTTSTTGKELKPLKIKCTGTDCERGLHCFRITKKMRSANERGKCKKCKADLIDWDRVHRRDPRDVGFTFESLRRELIRHHFWHIEMSPRATDYARRKGTIGLREATRRIVRHSVGDAAPFRDGRQTPREGSVNPVHYAQHATASCCRKCVEVWHGIEQGRALADAEIDYLTELAMAYLVERLPMLTKEGELVPRRKEVATQT